MSAKRRSFTRKSGSLRYKKMFVIATEGRCTEVQYFSSFGGQNSTIRIKTLRGKDRSAPFNVLERMEQHIKKEGLKKTDKAWLVVDKDDWTDDQLEELYLWSTQKENYGFALSNPKFEYWLLLHFEDGKKMTSSQACSERLKKHIPEYDKHLDMKKISDEMIMQAISRARTKDSPPCDKWPNSTGTTVYKLVQSILNSRSNTDT